MKLLVAIDFSPSSQRLIGFARALADSLRAEVWLLHVADPEPAFVGYDPGPQVERDQVAIDLRREHRELQGLAEEWRAAELNCTALQVQGPTVETIIAEASRLAVDMILLGAQGKGFMQRLFVGSTSEGVLRHAKIPVLIVPPP
jgi:nucleotide-binding universal stress UspA family protein